MNREIVVIGAGMGGLTAALAMARQGCRVRVFEARGEAGGLASAFQCEGFTFDAGPYILLDRPGLEWAFHALGLQLGEQVVLRPIPDVYEVNTGSGEPLRVYSDLQATAAQCERRWPGSGRQYENYIRSVAEIHRRLEPMLHRPRPGALELLRSGAWRAAPFLLRPLGAVLERTGLPETVIDTLAIWTHVAGQSKATAPSPLAFVPMLIHSVGACYPEGGIGAIPRALAEAARAAGVAFHFDSRIRAIRSRNGSATGIETVAGEFVPADAVIANSHGVGTYLQLVEGLPTAARSRLERLPLQSPGICIYLTVRGAMKPPYLRFRLTNDKCRLLVLPGVVAPELNREGWWPARLIAPMDHRLVEADGEPGQQAVLQELLEETWWRDGLDDVRVLATRIPQQWNEQFHLYQQSMNPVMTASFMRAGRLAHRSPYLKRLYLAGSSTHPGQWVSFTAISGILAARQALEDLS